MAINLEIEITIDDVRLILGDRYYTFFQKAVETAQCPKCGKAFSANMEIESIWLNHIGDIILEGTCKDCGAVISKYVEASNFASAYEQAMALRELKMEVLKDYNARLAGS